MTGRFVIRAVPLLPLIVAMPGALGAQASAYPDPPTLEPAATLVVPAVRSATLANGVRLRVVEQHELPLHSFQRKRLEARIQRRSHAPRSRRDQLPRHMRREGRGRPEPRGEESASGTGGAA